MRINEAGLDIIRESEGLELEAYICPAGKPTIGYGHTGLDVKLGDVITEEVAERLLQDAAEAEAGVLRVVKVPLNANEFSALVSWVFNFGETKVRGTRTLSALNADDKYIFPNEMLHLWVKSGDKALLGLVKRRKKEQALFRLCPTGTATRPHQQPLKEPALAYQVIEKRGAFAATSSETSVTVTKRSFFVNKAARAAFGVSDYGHAELMSAKEEKKIGLLLLKEPTLHSRVLEANEASLAVSAKGAIEFLRIKPGRYELTASDEAEGRLETSYEEGAAEEEADDEEDADDEEESAEESPGRRRGRPRRAA